MRIEVQDWKLGDFGNVRIASAVREKQALPGRAQLTGSGAVHDETSRSLINQASVPLHKAELEE